MRYSLFLAILLFSSSAMAQIHTLFVETKECPLNAFCRKEYGYGTCFAVAYSPSRGEYIYLTAGHNLKGSSGKATVCRVEVGGLPARVVGGWVKTGEVDFAIVASKQTATLRALSPVAPAVGEEVILAGYDFAASRTTPTLRRMPAKIVQTDPGKFCITSVSTTTGMSGGPVVNAKGYAVGMVVYDSAMLGNWPSARSFRDSVRHYFPDSEFANFVDSAPPPPKLSTPSDIPMRKKDPVKETTRQMTPQEIGLTGRLKEATSELARVKEALKAEGSVEPDGQKATGSGASKIIEKVVKAAPVIKAVAEGAGVAAGGSSLGLVALAGPYAPLALAGLWVAREAVPRVTAWRRRRKKKVTEGATYLAEPPLMNVVPVAPEVEEDIGLRDRLARAEARLATPPKYIDVPVDHWNRAYNWAKAQMNTDRSLSVKDHYFKQESLIRQFLAATYSS